MDSSVKTKLGWWSQYQGAHNRISQLQDEDLFFMNPSYQERGVAVLHSLDSTGMKAEYYQRKKEAKAVANFEGAANVVRAAKLSGQAFLFPVESSVSALITNTMNRNPLFVATNSVLRNSARMAKVFVEDIGRLDAPGKEKTRIMTDALEGNVAFMMSRQADSSKYADELRAAMWGHKTGRIMSNYTMRDGMELSVLRGGKDDVMNEARFLARLNLTKEAMRTHADPLIRRYSRLQIGSVSDAAWDKFVRSDGNLWLLRNDDYAAYIEVNGALSEWARRGSGNATDNQAASQPLYERRDHWQGAAMNSATMFTKVVGNITGTARRRWTQNSLEGIDNVSWFAAGSMMTLLFYAGSSMYIRNHLLRNKDMDITEWDDEQWVRFMSSALAYSTFGGIVSDFASVGVQGLYGARTGKIDLTDELVETRFPGVSVMWDGINGIKTAIEHADDPDLVKTFGGLWRGVGPANSPFIRTPASYLVEDWERASRDTLASQFASRP